MGFRVERIGTGGHENTRTLAEDMFLFALNSVKLCHILFAQKGPSSAWTGRLTSFSGPTEMIGHLSMVPVHVMECVDRNIL